MTKGFSTLYRSLIYGVVVAGHLHTAQAQFIEDEAGFAQQSEQLQKGWGWQTGEVKARVSCNTSGTDCTTVPETTTADTCDEFNLAIAEPPIGDESGVVGNRLTGDVVFVNGVRYTMARSDFQPVYRDLSFGTCPNGTKLVGYRATLDVIGDTGKPLAFDFSGRSDKSVGFRARCGTFDGSDTGTKYIVNREMTTAGSCQQMTLEYSFDWTQPPSSLELTFSILALF